MMATSLGIVVFPSKVHAKWFRSFNAGGYFHKLVYNQGMEKVPSTTWKIKKFAHFKARTKNLFQCSLSFWEGMMP